MEFKIFEAEKNLCLDMQIRANASISYLSRPIPKKELAKASIKAVVVDDSLYPICDILVSTGWNLNDDVFSAKATWQARKSPLFKPLDLEHEQANIIGSIIGTRVVDDELNVIDESEYDDDNPPSSFHLLNDTVIYRTWTDATKLEEIDDIIAEIKDGTYFMSMEAQFWGFDYAVEAPDGTQFVIERSEDTAFLTQYLRAYEGEGKYTDASTGGVYKIGRMMSHINFVGKGLVKNPGNPKSVIFNNASVQKNGVSNNEENSQTSTVQENITMDDKEKLAFEARIKDLEAKLAERDGVVTASLKSELETVKAELAGKIELISTLETAKSGLETAKAGIASELETAQTELKAAKDKAARTDRKKKMIDAGYTEDEAEKKVDTYAALSDEPFNVMISEISDIRKSVPAPVEKTPEQAAATLLASVTPTETAPVIPNKDASKSGNKFTGVFDSIFASTKNTPVEEN